MRPRHPPPECHGDLRGLPPPSNVHYVAAHTREAKQVQNRPAVWVIYEPAK
jgi:hypothetical protein